MQLDPLTSGFSPMTASAGPIVTSGDPRAFSVALQAVMTGIDQANTATVDALWALQQRLLTPAGGWYQGQGITNVAAAFTARSELLGDFTTAIAGVFADNGIATTAEMRFRIDEAGQIRLANDHPDRTRLEALINGSPVLSGAITRILQDTQRLAMAVLAQQGKATPELAAAMRQGLSLNLLDAGHGLIADVRYGGAVLASSDDKADWSGLIASLDQVINAFDEAERQRRIAYDQEMAKLKLDDDRRRTGLKQAKDQDLADKLAEKVAAERRAHVHPEQGHTPVFI